MSEELLDGVVMAAGAGRRMGGRPKALLERDGEALLARQIRLMTQAGIQRIAVVLGHHAARIAQLLDQLPLPPDVQLLRTHNPKPEDDPGSSLRCALQVLPQDGRAVMVVLADQPLLQAEDLQTLRSAWMERAPGIVLAVPLHAGVPGHPIILGSELRRAVLRDGATVRAWRAQHPERVLRITVDHARCTTDLDTPEDLARIARETGIALQWPADLHSDPFAGSGTIEA